MRALLLLSLLICSAAAQRLSLGVAGGGSITNAFWDRVQSQPPYDDDRSYSEAKDYLIGPSIEWAVTPRWSVEVDALYRKLHMTTEAIRPNGERHSISPSPVITWQFPVLAKYRFVHRAWTPFIEGGPSFRTAGNLNGTNPSHVGATAGIGLERRWGRLKFAPSVRYTRWRRDDPRWFYQTASNQVEFLFSVSGGTSSDWRPLGRRVSIGVILGASLTDDVAPHVERFANVFSQTWPGPRQLIAGPALELFLPRRLSLEVDALHHPIAQKTRIEFAGNPPQVQEGSLPTWEFPVLLKQRFRWRGVEPFIGLGPSFRRPQAYSFSSPYGAVAGVGVDIPWGRVRFSPTVRYTRWARSSFGIEQLRLNQSQVLASVTF